MAKKNIIFVKIIGTGIQQSFRARSHELMGLPAGTYHKFEMENGATLLLNDFGIRSITLADDIGDLD